MKWSWKYDEEKSHTHRLEQALYFPNYPVNIISSAYLSDWHDDYNGSYIKTKHHSYEFSWNYGQYTSTITHSDNFLDEIPINDVYEVFGLFLKIMKFQMDLRIYFYNCSYMTQTDIPEDSWFPQVGVGAAILTHDKYSSDEEEDNEIFIWSTK